MAGASTTRASSAASMGSRTSIAASTARSVRLAEHDDADHPVFVLAKRRITKLSARREATAEAIAALEASAQTAAAPRRSGPRPPPSRISAER